MQNIFDVPDIYLKEFVEKDIFDDEIVEQFISEYNGLSMMCAWITKKCPLNCSSCFFKSNMNHVGMPEENELSDEGIEKLIKFVNDSNSGYLMLSGGGDPMICKEKVYRIIEKTKTKRIVLVTSGFWAKDYAHAEQIIDDLYKAFNNNPYGIKFVLRLSVDTFHSDAMNGAEAFYNIIKIFKDKYRSTDNFILMIHTLMNDGLVEEITSNMDGKLILGKRGNSDNKDVIKIVPQKSYIKLDDYKITVGISKLFYSNLLADLRNLSDKTIKSAIKVMIQDIEMSEQDNPSYIQNTSGEKGLDFWLDYNGNITTWFNQDWNSLYNIYIDDYKNVVKKTFSYPVTARFLKKGFQYRNSIVSEVNSKAVLRSQAINLRDYVSAIILEEKRTKLYYAIRVIQDYLIDFYIDKNDLDVLSSELKAFIFMGKLELIDYYKKSSYDILVQSLDENNFNQQLWYDLFVLIKLGHYDIEEENLNKYLDIYSRKMNIEKITIDDIKVTNSIDDYQRFHNKISFIKPEAKTYIASN